MEHIKENKLTINKRTYYRTDDPNIVKGIFAQEEEIHLDKLQARIGDLESEIAAFQPKEYPRNADDVTKEAIDLYNERYLDTENRQQELTEKKELLDKVRWP